MAPFLKLPRTGAVSLCDRNCSGQYNLQHRGEHAHPEIKYCQWENDANSKADPPDSRKMIFASSRYDDQKDWDGKGAAELVVGTAYVSFFVSQC